MSIFATGKPELEIPVQFRKIFRKLSMGTPSKTFPLRSELRTFLTSRAFQFPEFPEWSVLRVLCWWSAPSADFESLGVQGGSLASLDRSSLFAVIGVASYLSKWLDGLERDEP